MDILIRPYVEKDYDEMVDVTMELWNLKMSPYTKKNIGINTEIIKDTGSISKEYDEGIFIAEVDNHVAGVIHLGFKGKKASKGERLSNVKLILKYGLIKLLKVQSVGQFFEHEVSEEELHIHGVVVSDKYRGLGIGTKLFSFLEKFALRKNLSKITLEVLSSNSKAHELYQKLGFTEYKNTAFTKKQQKLFKAKTHIYMVKEINR